MIDERILDKIKKCLALSKSSEPNEAATALRQAQKLMQAHNINSRTLMLVDVGSVDVKSKFSVSKLKDYEIALVNVISTAFGCKTLWGRSHSRAVDVFGTFTLVGMKTQLELAEYTTSVMQHKLVKARYDFVKSLPPYFSIKDKTIQADGFCQGWVASVAGTIKAFANDASTEELIEEKVNTMAGGQAKVDRRTGGALGFKAGQEKGLDESIYRPMNETKNLMLGIK